LTSINQAWFPAKKIKLIISIDGGATQDTIDISNNFQFKHGEKHVYIQKNNLGVKRHILKCSEFSLKYGSVIVLEDDLFVGPAFYEFAIKTLSFYDNDSNIAGIALYSQRYNETSQLPFEPLESKWSVYFMQLGCSWGQAWTKKQWLEFKNWNEKSKQDKISEQPIIPENIRNWPNSSWKKNYNKYLIDTEKYIVYPYSSYTTNISEQGGTHMHFVENRFQVPVNISSRLRDGFKLPELNSSSIKYDAYMESKSDILKSWLNFDNSLEIEMDLYGKKPIDLLRRKPFALTSKKVKNHIRSFPLTFRPLEFNLKFSCDSKDRSFFYLVSTATLTGDERERKTSYLQFVVYFMYGMIKSKKFLKLYINIIIKKLFKHLR
jgi:hypothetical protein